MTKRDLIKWIESQKQIAINKAIKAKDDTIERAKNAEYHDIDFDNFINEVYPIMQEFIKKYEEFVNKVNAIDGMSISHYGWNCGVNEFKDKFDSKKDMRVRVSKLIKLDTKKYNTRKDAALRLLSDVEKTYDIVITTIKNLPTAKDGLEYLEKLGFNIKDIPNANTAKQLPATISVNVNTAYLLLPKENDNEIHGNS